MTQLNIFEPNEAYKPKAKPLKAAEIDIIYKNPVQLADRPKVTCSRDSYEVVMEAWNENHIDLCEDFNVIHLNRGHRVLGTHNVSKGGVSGTVADPKIVFMAALKSNASAIILAHNHPSGELKPSAADITLTRKMAEVGKALDLPVLDHLIVTTNGYYSFADEGIMP